MPCLKIPNADEIRLYGVLASCVDLILLNLKILQSEKINSLKNKLDCIFIPSLTKFPYT